MKAKSIVILLLYTVILTACGNGVDAKEHLEEIYSLALDVMMERDEALNSDMEFIAIDMSNFEELNEADGEDVLTYFQEKYNVEVLDTTFEELQESGRYNPETMTLDGVLLQFDNVDFKFNNNVWFEGSKYRSGLGAIGMEITVHYDDGQWRVKESKDTWIS